MEPIRHCVWDTLSYPIKGENGENLEELYHSIQSDTQPWICNAINARAYAAQILVLQANRIYESIILREHPLKCGIRWPAKCRSEAYQIVDEINSARKTALTRVDNIMHKAHEQGVSATVLPTATLIVSGSRVKSLVALIIASAKSGGHLELNAEAARSEGIPQDLYARSPYGKDSAQTIVNAYKKVTEDEIRSFIDGINAVGRYLVIPGTH
jgi:hypothetical protein